MSETHPMSGDGSRQAGASSQARPEKRRAWAPWLLLIPFPALLYPPFYAREHPRVAGIPFFLWYQIAWVIIGGVVTGVVYLLRDAERGQDG
jgi:Protein of unknown function (DUF3311)